MSIKAKITPSTWTYEHNDIIETYKTIEDCMIALPEGFLVSVASSVFSVVSSKHEKILPLPTCDFTKIYTNYSARAIFQTMAGIDIMIFQDTCLKLVSPLEIILLPNTKLQNINDPSVILCVNENLKCQSPMFNTAILDTEHIDMIKKNGRYDHFRILYDLNKK